VTVHQARIASKDTFILAEGPVWDPAHARVLWVDVHRGEVLEGVLVGDDVEVTARHQFEGTVGAVVSAADGRLLVAGQEQLVVLGSAGVRTPGPRIVPSGAASRTNDGATDPAGRFLIGTLSTGTGTGTGDQSLVRVDDDGRLTVIDDDLWLSNGIAWSADGSSLYTVDTLPGVIWVRDYDVRTGATGPRRVHLHLVDEFPDGMCLDTAGNLWIAVWGAGQVRCYAPDGTLVDVVHVPAPHTSSVAFVGPARDLLLITTARADLTAEQLDDHPDSGRLFTARVGAVGLPTTAWSGTWAGPPTSRPDMTAGTALPIPETRP
jgi:sugar lactone lactonase YvrE